MLGQVASGGEPRHLGQLAGQSILDERGVGNDVRGPQGPVADVVNCVQGGEDVSQCIGGDCVVLPGDADVGQVLRKNREIETGENGIDVVLSVKSLHGVVCGRI